MNNEKIKFRKVERKDLGEVFLLLQQLTEIDYSNRDEEDCWNKFNSNTSSNSIVGLYKDKVIAYGSLVVENKIRGEAAGHIEDIVVDNKVRGNNVGVMLIDELIKIGKEKECYRITLFCKEHLIKFYNKNGFEVNSMAMKLFPK
jgi:predicted GNAT family N-acyltransferase|tara:strand:+ start:106 stop:537 length:432 start_codon:yes stop_codon:yes gene_type:complete